MMDTLKSVDEIKATFVHPFPGSPVILTKAQPREQTCQVHWSVRFAGA